MWHHEPPWDILRHHETSWDIMSHHKTPFWWKNTLRSCQDLNLGLLNAGQMLLPTEPLELWHWSRGIIISIDIAQFSGWISMCRLYSARWVPMPKQLGTEVLLCWTQWTGYLQSLCMCRQNPITGRPETFPLLEKSHTIKCFAYL